MEAVESMITKQKRRKKLKNNDQNTDDHIKNPSTKMIIDFDCESSVSIDLLAVNKNSSVKVTTRFFSGKMIMFAKLSPMSFIYDMVETFYFPNKKNIQSIL